MCSRTKPVPVEAVGKLDSEGRSQPLQSVGNQINQNLTGKQQDKKNTNKTAKMNSSFALPSLKIRNEPFADFYTVEKEIGRYVPVHVDLLTLCDISNVSLVGDKGPYFMNSFYILQLTSQKY